MGGGGPSESGVSSESASQVKSAVDQQIAKIASKGQSIVVGCEDADRHHLERLLAVIAPDSVGSITIASPTSAATVSDAVSSASFVISFSHSAKSFEYLNSFISAAANAGKLGVHARGIETATIPASVGTFRWRVYMWDQVIEMLK